MGKNKPMNPSGGGFSKGISKVPTTPRPQPITPRPAIPQIKIAPKPVIVPRPTAVILPRGASPVRIQSREIKHEAWKQTSQSNIQKPVLTVRPSSSPLKVMPKQPAPTPVRPQQVRPGAQPASSLKSIQRPSSPPMPTQLKSTSKTPAPVRPATVRPPGAGLAATAGAAAIGSLVLNAGQAHPDITNEVYSLNSSLQDLQDRSTLSQIQADVTELDSALNHLVGLLESARDKGFVYQKDLDEDIYRIMDQWQPIRQNVLNTIPQQAANLQNSLRPISGQVSRLNSVMGNPVAAQPLLSNTYSQVNTLLGNVYEVEGSLRNSYSQIESQASSLTTRLNTIHWALNELGESKIETDNNEDMVMAVPARWDKSGDDDPEGILFLTNKRLAFERKEKVATKKLLFITMASELVQEVMFDQKLTDIREVKAQNKGLFGNQDFIEIQFADKKLGLIPFHINGQDSSTWASLIDKAKSGEIESDRSTGSGLSYSDMAGPITTADLLAIQNQVNQLQDMVTLKPVREEIAAVENDTRELDRRLADLRNRGYVIEKSLNVDVTVLTVQWERIKTNAETVLNNQVALLGSQMASIQKMMTELAGQAGNLQTARPGFLKLKSTIASTEAQADAADDAVITQYDEYANEVETLTAHMEWVAWMLDALSTASFKLLATESGVAATEAVWERVGFEPENGILFLTDQRLMWEDRVEKFELEFDLPLSEITDVNKEVEEVNGQEFLNFTLSAKGPYPVTRFKLALPVADAWLKMIGRARSGDYAVDRAVQIDQAELDRIRNAPRQCPNCGAGLTNTILRGQTEITCEYCGNVVRI